MGGGQSPGEGIGNGRAVAMRFAREGARVLVADRRLESAEETAALICAEGFEAIASDVGVSLAGGDADLLEITEESFDNIVRINLRGTVFACKHAVAIMREQRSGVIVNVASAAGPGKYPYAAYKASKAGVIAFTEQLALQNAPFGIRANSILPGLIGTPMAVETRSKAWNMTREQIRDERAAKVPLGRQGSGWDVANAALFLACEESSFITGVSLLVDGGRILNRI